MATCSIVSRCRRAGRRVCAQGLAWYRSQSIVCTAIDKSVKRNEIIFLERGIGHKMLKQYLSTAHGLTAEEYRVRWELGRDYPLLALNDAKQRSEMVKKIGLGRKPGAVKSKRSKARRKR